LLPAHVLVNGAQLRIVGERASAMGWTTDLSPSGLAETFNRLAVRGNSPRLPQWPVSNTLRPSPAGNIQPL
jgi:hypothetical protein